MRAGVSIRRITPDRPIYLSGYASRDHRSEGVYQDLYVKALALAADDPASTPAVIVTSDLLYYDDAVLDPVEAELARDPGLSADRLFFTASHTHCGPVIDDRSNGMFGEVDEDYVAMLRGALADVVRAAVSDLRPATLAYHRGTCGFNVNRRLRTENGVQMLPNPAGAVDRDVDVLTVREAGKMRAVFFRYTCHPTTMGEYLRGGDYPGFAQAYVEEAFPGATALFVQGCTGDVRPNNVDEQGRFRSGPLAVVEEYGRLLGAAVVAAVGEPGTPVVGEIRTADEAIPLPLAPHPARVEFERALATGDRWRRAWAERIVAKLDRGERLPESVPVHVQTLRIGDELDLVAMAGEVCVHIGMRMKELIGEKPRFVLAYTNRVRHYIPTAKILSEGGYEAESYIYHDVPSAYTGDAEDLLVAAAQRMLGGGRREAIGEQPGERSNV